MSLFVTKHNALSLIVKDDVGEPTRQNPKPEVFDFYARVLKSNNENFLVGKSYFFSSEFFDEVKDDDIDIDEVGG